MDSNKFDDLIIQSGLIADGCWDKFDQYDKEAIMKFGQLLIQECISITNDQYFAYEAVEALQKRFGVNE